MPRWRVPLMCRHGHEAVLWAGRRGSHCWFCNAVGIDRMLAPTRKPERPNNT